MDLKDPVQTIDKLKQFLARYNQLGECIIVDIQLHHYQTILDLVLNYVWDETGTYIRTNIDEEPEMILFQFGRVQEIHFQNTLNNAMLTQPDQLNWGMNEIAAFRLVDDSQLLVRYQNLPLVFHHVQIQWEGERCIEVVFADIEVKRLPHLTSSLVPRSHV